MRRQPCVVGRCQVRCSAKRSGERREKDKVEKEEKEKVHSKDGRKKG